jgi:hypothetical protein
MTQQRNWSGLEIPLLFGLLVGGAFLRYWLSTAVPFDPVEMAALAEASVPIHALRIPFIMFSGLSLFMLYIIARRSAGVPAAFAAIFALQTSIAFQLIALRIRWQGVIVLLVLLVAAYLRFSWPPWRPPRRVDLMLIVVTALLVVRGIVLVVTLPERLDSIRDTTRADGSALYASLVACGGDRVTPLANLSRCQLAWPQARSLDQQEAMLAHAQMLKRNAELLDGSSPVPMRDATHVAVFDSEGVALFLAAEGETLATTRRVLGIGR